MMNFRARTDDFVQLTSQQDYLPQFTEVAPYYDRVMSSVPYRMWVDYLELLFGMIAFKPARIVDLACGTGNVTFELARRGYRVTGVDRSPQMVEVAKKKRDLRDRTVEFLVGDLRELSPGDPFDLATCLYDSLNYVTEPNDLQRAFSRVRACVVAGGYFIFDLNSVHALEQELFTQNNLAWANTLRYLWKSRYNPNTRISEIRMQFSVRESDGAIREFNEMHYERAYELEEVEGFLRAAGWNVVHVFDAYTTHRPRDDSERWFFVARKPV